jgi:hypothetical protein
VHRTEAPDQLFGLADDPFETRDVIADHPQRAAAMLARTRSILDDYARRGPQMEVQSQIDPEHRRELEALGYAE